MRRNLAILAGVSAAAVLVGIYSQSGDVGVGEAEVAETETAPAQAAASPAAPAEPEAASQPEIEAEIARLAAALASREAELHALAADLAARDATLADRDATLAERDATLAEIAATLAERDAEIAQLRFDLDALRARFAFDVQLAAAKSGVAPDAPQVEAARADAADLDDMLAFAKPSAALDAAADAPMTAIHFETGSAAITPGGRIHAAVAAAMLSEMPLERIRLTGFADRTGDPGRNRRLAERRAETVAALLVAAGLPADRIETSGVVEAAALPVSTDPGVPEPLNRAVSIVAVPLPTT